jgi:peptide/nickel transport system substrate-binding protein
VLRVGSSSALGSLDVAKSTGGSVGPELSLETLVQSGTDGKLHPWLASSVTVPSPTVYVYHLRRGVKFWDGTEMTAADVANSLNYYRAPGSRASYVYTTVKSIKATGRYTVVVTLTRPDASWPFGMAEWAGQIFEKKFFDEHRSSYGQPGTLVMGTGPWMPVSLDPTSGEELSANPHYWGGKVKIDHISVKYFSDQTSEAIGFRSGAIDLAIPDAPQSFASTAGTTLVRAPGCGKGFFSMNVTTPPWSDVHVRRAVAYALNRAAIIRANGGYARPSYVFIPTISMDTLAATPARAKTALKSIPVYAYNLAKAKQELAKSAYPNGFTADTPVVSLGSFPNIIQVIASQLKAIGINLKLQTVTADKWLAALTGPAAQRPSGYVYDLCGRLDPSFQTLYLGRANTKPGVWNIASYAPPALEPLLSASVATTNPTKRLAIYVKILQRLAADEPYVPLFNNDVTLAIASNFTWPTFNTQWYERPWALGIKAKA